MMKAQGSAVLEGADYVVPVPLHPVRQFIRGFNQAADLAEGLGLPIVLALKRTRHTASQADLPASRRHANVRGAFRLDGKTPVRGARVVLVDDVSTTGATLDACARVLISAGARDARALIAARAVTREPRAPLR
jgi:ComF family protein